MTGAAWRTGVVLAAALGLGAVTFSLVGGLGVEVAARRGLRAVLLVLVATWLRSAAGADGLRAVFRRVLGRLRRLPAVPEAIRALDHIGSEGHLVRAGRSLVSLAGETQLTVVALVDTVLELGLPPGRPLPVGAAAGPAGVAGPRGGRGDGGRGGGAGGGRVRVGGRVGCAPPGYAGARPETSRL